ncbi:MAG: hypothetical protein J7465_13605, partial [Chloroflexus sp.]|nr:hypothetical protein [Chloroflexus sp.]
MGRLFIALRSGKCKRVSGGSLYRLFSTNVVTDLGVVFLTSAQAGWPLTTRTTDHITAIMITSQMVTTI